VARRHAATILATYETMLGEVGMKALQPI
jgi:hypothetical protein